MFLIVSVTHSTHPHSLDPDERVVKLRVDGLQVFQSQRFIQDALIKGQREACVYELSMKESLREKENPQIIEFQTMILQSVQYRH